MLQQKKSNTILFTNNNYAIQYFTDYKSLHTTRRAFIFKQFHFLNKIFTIFIIWLQSQNTKFLVYKTKLTFKIPENHHLNLLLLVHRHRFSSSYIRWFSLPSRELLMPHFLKNVTICCIFSHSRPWLLSTDTLVWL